MRKLFFAIFSIVLAGCATTNPRPEVSRAAAHPSGPPVGVIFVANGAGDTRTLTQNMVQVVSEAGLPLQIETVAWSRGYGRVIADQIDHDNHLCHGRQLAAQVAAYRQSYPNRRIYFIGHSAGSAVLLAAADMLPPDSVDRIVLLAPSVCQSYDLRPALRTARYGVDSFISSQDRWFLGLGVKIVGTAEHGCRTAAGRAGFTPVITCPADAPLYGKLRQHPWDPALSWTGHDGGHFGNNQIGFLRAYVLPLMAVTPG